MNHKYLKTALTSLLLTGSLLIPIGLTAQADGIDIYVNDVALSSDVAPVISDNRTMLPLRACAEALDATVNYADGVITMTRQNTSITLHLGSADADINGSISRMDVVPMVINSRTLVPLRFISEAFSCPVQWDGANRSVHIRTTTSGQQFVRQEIPSENTIVNQVTQQINNIRLQKQLEAFIPITELANMATAHSRDMADNDFIGLISPEHGNTAERAAAYVLPNVSELVAQVDYNTATVADAVEAWFRDDTARAILLDPTAAYIGIGVENPTDSDEVLVTAEILPSWAYFLNMPQESTVTTAELRLTGRSTRTTETISIYKLSEGNEHTYSDKQTYEAKVNSGRFYVDAVLWGEGKYAIRVANSIVYVDYLP